ncbi:Panthothenate kinase [Paracoccus isoporae]|uniref:Panthothenate kinase n=1 Tax=Paracoccus isoporae TaxID=591205 RepID=A0A1G7DG69_9RHOB|nr:nucleoside/nucleotide kinase family protein [Paracoccus isoporae]SDE50594.1 Panthothenate kinase [Paracoccus isoporae]
MTEDTTLAALLSRLGGLDRQRRHIVAIAGAPASGKSRIAAWLDERIADAAVLPMDGFHYDDAVLEARDLLPRKGAPATFDVDGLAHMLARLAADDGRDIAVPVFDRGLEISRAGGRIIPPKARLILCEGNYLLLDDPAWTALAPFFDLTIMVTASLDLIETRLARRWQDHPEAQRKMQENDLPNARLVMRASRPADLRLRNDDDAA